MLSGNSDNSQYMCKDIGLLPKAQTISAIIPPVKINRVHEPKQVKTPSVPKITASTISFVRFIPLPPHVPNLEICRLKTAFPDGH